MAADAQGIVWDDAPASAGIQWDDEKVDHQQRLADAEAALAAEKAKKPQGALLHTALAALDNAAAGASNTLVGGIGGSAASLAGRLAEATGLAAPGAHERAREWVDRNMVYHNQEDYGKPGADMFEQAVGNAVAPVARGAQAVDAAVGRVSPTAQNVLRQTLGTAADVAGAVPLARPAAVLARSIPAAGSRVVGAFQPSVQANRVLREVAGTPEQRLRQTLALREASPVGGEGTPNGGATAAEMVSTVPEGTTLQALQRQVASVPDRGVSIDFARRLAARKEAFHAAADKVDEATAPLRQAALGQAAASGGVKADALWRGMQSSVDPSIVNGTPIAQKVMEGTKKFVMDNMRPDGTIDPATLYQFRKTGLGQIVEDAAGQDLNASKFAKTKVARNIQQAIDNGIVEAGGKDWPTYMKEYSTRIKPVEDAKQALEDMYKPENPTSLAGAGQMDDSIRAPHLISRNLSLVNYGLGLRRMLMEKAVNRHIADKLLDPSALSDVLSADLPVSIGPTVRPLARALVNPSLLSRPPGELGEPPSRQIDMLHQDHLQELRGHGPEVTLSPPEGTTGKPGPYQQSLGLGLEREGLPRDRFEQPFAGEQSGNLFRSELERLIARLREGQ